MSEDMTAEEWSERWIEMKRERDRLREALEHIAGQNVISIGNPYQSFARNALKETND